MVQHRDKMGYIKIEELDIQNKSDINYNLFSFEYNGKKYYFKQVKNVNRAYNELIGYELAKDFGIECVSYDLASYNGFIGYLSEDYMKDGYKRLSGLLSDYYGNIYNRCNYNDVSSMFFDMYEEDSNELIDQLLLLIMFDVIIGNFDRHDENIIIDVENKRLAPISDNEMLLGEQAVYGGYFSFSIDNNKTNTLSRLIEYLPGTYREFFLKKIQIISRENILSVFARVEEKIGCSMNLAVKKELLLSFEKYYKYLMDKIEKFNKEKLALKKEF